MAFVQLFRADDLPPGLRSTVFHQFDKRLPEVLGDLYEKLNGMLEDAGFGFQSGSGARGGRPRGSAGASGGSGGGGSGGAVGSAGQAEAGDATGDDGADGSGLHAQAPERERRLL